MYRIYSADGCVPFGLQKVSRPSPGALCLVAGSILRGSGLIGAADGYSEPDDGGMTAVAGLSKTSRRS